VLQKQLFIHEGELILGMHVNHEIDNIFADVLVKLVDMDLSAQPMFSFT
jgi:hypothetical protein